MVRKKSLTWKLLDGYHPSYGTSRTRAQIQDAFNDWARYAPLTFREVPQYEEADFELAFIHRFHDDIRRFDGPGGILAYSYFPPSGIIRFEAEEPWTDDTTGFNLHLVATHVIGHALGLGDSNDPSSIMFERYQLFQPEQLLPRDVSNNILYNFIDRAGIQALYGLRSTPRRTYPTTTRRITTRLPTRYIPTSSWRTMNYWPTTVWWTTRYSPTNTRRTVRYRSTTTSRKTGYKTTTVPTRKTKITIPRRKITTAPTRKTKITIPRSKTTKTSGSTWRYTTKRSTSTTTASQPNKVWVRLWPTWTILYPTSTTHSVRYELGSTKVSKKQNIRTTRFKKTKTTTSTTTKIQKMLITTLPATELIITPKETEESKQVTTTTKSIPDISKLTTVDRATEKSIETTTVLPIRKITTVIEQIKTLSTETVAASNITTKLLERTSTIASEKVQILTITPLIATKNNTNAQQNI
ncbi:unnamed protein product [Adineta steineri]|uniref:Peptidase metallopeptidase domain-containing protein n=1 Tax=Adineta steineri TaxID=433720 RepID=A0A816BWS3_9BILA|nr:unnamed protein product [Adineta steineri]CAF1617029.1 unnamed protein product [Adineta steineri]